MFLRISNHYGASNGIAGVCAYSSPIVFLGNRFPACWRSHAAGAIRKDDYVLSPVLHAVTAEGAFESAIGFLCALGEFVAASVMAEESFYRGADYIAPIVR